MCGSLDDDLVHCVVCANHPHMTCTACHPFVMTLQPLLALVHMLSDSLSMLQ